MLAIALLLALVTAPAEAQSDLEFLREEAQVTSASRRAQGLARAPATVYVVTARQIRESGAQTIPEALRGVPGVDVMATRAMQGEVSIRGLNRPLSNRTLVLVDGRTVLNGFYDFVVWESLPITLDEIERIEVVEGPVSALYGPNAVNGVINIITKRPLEIGTAQAGVTAGEDGLLLGSALTGGSAGPWAYKLDLGWRSADRFQGGGQASQAKLASAMLSRDLGQDGTAALSAGLNQHRTNFSAGRIGSPVDDGTTGFLRGDWTRGLTKARAYWNYGRTTFREVAPERDLDYDTVDVQLEQGFSPAAEHDAVAGLEYRRNQADSLLFGPSDDHAQDLWAGFLEDDWRITDEVSLDLAARLDHHPLTGWRLSPRGALVWQPQPEHTLRLSAGTAYRNPTLVENYLDLTQTQGGAIYTRLGRSALDPERASQAELAYLGQYERLRARAGLFAYRLRNTISFESVQQVSAGPPPAFLIPATNVGGTRAWGGETQLEAPLGWGFSGSAGWSLSFLKDDNDSQSDADSAPRHKVSGAVTWRRAGWTLACDTFWQSATAFRSNSRRAGPFVETERVADYWLLSARLAYAFSGGVEAALSGWNLADRRHFEVPAFSNGELLGRRVAGTLSWRFP